MSDMRENRIARAGLAVSAGLVAAAIAWAPPTQAGPIDDSFLSLLNNAGVNVGDPGSAAALGQSVCPMLTQPAGSFASAASSLTGSNGGMSPEMAQMFTEIAVSVYCPQMLSQLAHGQLPQLPQIPGVPGIPIPGL